MNAAIIIETRPQIDTTPAIESIKKYLPGWAIIGEIGNQLKFEIRTFQDYNRTLTSEVFWEILFYFERVLIFQHDSGLLREGIDEFLQYDYVGAPWKFQEHGGNGGLSLRNPKIMLQIIQNRPYHSVGVDGNEDIYFCNQMFNQKIGNLAPREVCEKFSVESIFKLGTLGWHAIDRYLTSQQCEQIRKQYDNVSEGNIG